MFSKYPSSLFICNYSGIAHFVRDCPKKRCRYAAYAAYLHLFFCNFLIMAEQ